MSQDFSGDEGRSQRYGRAKAYSRNRVGKTYKQFYRKAWEEIPEFKEWLTSIPGERSKAYCKICEKSLHAHRLSLTKHTVSLKHMRMAQKKLQEVNTEIFNQEECYEEEGEEMSEGEVRYRLDESGHMVRMIKGEMSDEEGEGGNTPGSSSSQHPHGGVSATLLREEEVTVTGGVDDEHTLVYTSSHRLQGSDSLGTEGVPSDGVSLIKIIPKQKMSSSHERVNVITHHLSPGSRIIHTQPSSVAQGQAAMTEKPNITTHVLDITKGLPVAGLPVCLYQLMDGRWILLSESSTSADGRCNKLTGTTGIKPGRYKLHFDTERYFLLRHTPTFYPFVEVVFDICSPNDHNHVPLLLGPFGYTTYKGS